MDTQTFDFVWEESMRTGDELVDLQHQELIRRLNQLLHAMVRRDVDAEVPSMLSFLDRYIAEHFSHEETLMLKVQCPLVEANRRAHQEFLRRFEAFQEQMARDPGTSSLIAVKMLRDLSEWIVTHILHIDARMLPYVQARSARETSSQQGGENAR